MLHTGVTATGCGTSSPCARPRPLLHSIVFVRTRLKSLFMWLARLCVSRPAADPASSSEDPVAEPYQGHEPRVAYRLAYEAVLDWRDGSYTKLEAFRNRAAGLLSAAVIAGAAGIGVTAGEDASRGSLTWVGVSVAGSGLLLSLVAAGALMRPLKGPFVLEPEKLARNFGDNLGGYQTDDATYKAIALFGQEECSQLADGVRRRCRWLYMSVVGLPVTAVGAVLVWADAI